MIKTYDVFKAIFDKIKTLPYNVYDEVPTGAANPHIRVDYSTELENSGKDYDSKIYYQYIHVFSTYKGRKEVLQITDDVLKALSDEIETDTFVMYPQLERNEITTESDNIGGSIKGAHTNETYRHSIIVMKYTICEKK